MGVVQMGLVQLEVVQMGADRFGSLLIFQGSYFQCFGFIYRKNVNSVCMHTTMIYRGLSVMSNVLHCIVIIHICCEVMLPVFIIKDSRPLQKAFPMLTP